MYIAHPSSELGDLFARSPYQGVAPESATFLFIGLDANYDAQIERKPIFENILAYHADGVAFWRRYGVHHPFLMPGYSGDGRLYHRSFANIGFGPEHASLVSFVELLHLPTVGRSVLAPVDLLASHLGRINAAILTGNARHIFVSAGVVRLMLASRIFKWLPTKPVGRIGPLGVLWREGGRTVYSHLHFSVYGKFQEQKVREATAIRELLPSITER